MTLHKLITALVIILFTPVICAGQDDLNKSASSAEYGSNNKTGNYLNVNGINLYYEVYGEGKPLLVLHGSGGSIRSARHHLPVFIERYKVIAVDSRSSGKSVYTKTDLTYELMASDIKGLLDELRLDSVFIWGQSDGGILALIIAMNYPEKVSKLVAFAPNLIADTTGIEPPIYHYMAYMAQNSPDAPTKQRMNLMWKEPNIPFKDLKKIKADVLLMSGDRDVVPLVHTINIFKHITNSNLCIFPGATHRASWEKPQLFQQLVVEFFENPFKKPDSIDRYKMPK